MSTQFCLWIVYLSGLFGIEDLEMKNTSLKHSFVSKWTDNNLRTCFCQYVSDDQECVFIVWGWVYNTGSGDFSDLHEALSRQNTFRVVLTQVQLWSAEIQLIFTQLPCTYTYSLWKVRKSGRSMNNQSSVYCKKTQVASH